MFSLETKSCLIHYSYVSYYHFAVLLRSSVCLLLGEIKILFLCPNKFLNFLCAMKLDKFLDFFACYEIHAAQLCISLMQKHSATLQCRFLIMN